MSVGLHSSQTLEKGLKRLLFRGIVMAGMTREGLRIKRQIDVINDLKRDAVPIFQDLVPVGDIVDTSDASTLGRIIGLYSDPLSELWELSQAVYLAFDPDSATGRSLDDIVAYGGLTRRKETATTADVYVYGNVGALIQTWNAVRSGDKGLTFNFVEPMELSPEKSHGIGFVINDVQAQTNYRIYYRQSFESEYVYIEYTSDSSPSIDGVMEGILDEVNNSSLFKAEEIDGRIWVSAKTELAIYDFYVSNLLTLDKVIGVGKVKADKVGEYPQAPNTIDRIATPMWGWDSVTNPIQANTGQFKETDAQLRERFRNSKAVRATNIIESLYGSLYDLDGVNNIVIYENVEDYEDDQGLPPHSFLVIADGGLESEIAKAIWLNRPAGIKSYGNTDIDIIDRYGYTRTISFSRPIMKDIMVRMELTRFENFPPDGDEEIKSNLVNFVGSINTGQNLIYSRLYTPINRVVGHQVDNLEVSEDGGDTWVMQNINSDLDEKIRLLHENIIIS